MEALLVRKGLLEYVDGTKSTPLGSPNSKAVKDFMRKKAEAHAEIILHVEIPQLSHVHDHDPAVIWINLENVHCAHGFATHLMLCRTFHTLKKTDDISMQAWIATVRHTTFKLKEVDVDVSDEDLILVLTVGLPPSYENFIVSLDATPSDELTLEHVITHLMNEESCQSHSTDHRAPCDSTLLSHTHRRRVPLENITCFNCGEKGHYQSHCQKNTGDSKKEETAGAVFAF